MPNLDPLFARLAKSPFRSKFRLGGKELEYLRQKGIEEIEIHAARFIDERLAPANPPNDGKQTPFRNHPVFVAQHATATCCRGCVEKWHGIPRGRPLSADEKAYILEVLKRWINQQDSSLKL